jgi:hypothetical protein
MKIKLQILFILLLVFTLPAYTQIYKHPRVAEVEKYLSREALDLLKSRFPDHPFMATVSIDAVHRGSYAGKNESERLPYLEIDGEEIVDEWDDPSMSNIALLSRVKKVAVVLSLSDNLTDDEISEIKTTLYSSLNLIEARDSVEIRKRNFEKKPKPFLEENFSAFLVFSSLLWAMLIVGFGGLFWFLSARIKSGMKDIKIQAVNSGQTTGAANPLPQMDSAHDRSSKSSQISGDLKFSDPFKIKEILSTYVSKIEAMSQFPNLQQMVAFDEFCQKAPGECGSLLYELPSQHMKTLFSLSTENYWLQALNEPKELNSECIELLNKIVRLQDSPHPEIDSILIQMWRLNQEMELVPFVKSLNQNEAFTLIDKLPAHLGLAVARDAFPGSWGVLLNKSFSVFEFSKERIEFLDAQLQKMKPLRPLSFISKFKHDQDLIKYLLIADPQAEKEIYEAHETPETLISLRQPFFPVLEMSEEAKKEFSQKINIEDWAYSFFNLPRSERKSFEGFFSDKQKFRYFEILKQLDLKNPPREVVGRVREKIASYYFKYNENKARMKQQEENLRAQTAEENIESDQDPDSKQAA